MVARERSAPSPKVVSRPECEKGMIIGNQTRDFDMNLNVEFTDKVGRINPNPQLSTRGNYQQEDYPIVSAEAIAASHEAALACAFASKEGLSAVAEKYQIKPFCKKAEDIEKGKYKEYTEMSKIMREILDRNHGELDEETRYRANDNGILVFDARARYLDFQYVRFAHKIGFYDSAPKSLFPEDVDRLVTIGWLNDADFDFDLGRVILARGAYKRVSRQTGQPGVDGETLRDPYRWTIAKRTKKPTAQNILLTVAKNENKRYDSERESSKKVPTESTEERPKRSVIHLVWQHNRRKNRGIFGLEELGISDERALAMIKTCDATFISPEEQFPKLKWFGRRRPHQPSEQERLHHEPIARKEPPRHQLQVPDILVTDPPHSGEVATRPKTTPETSPAHEPMVIDELNDMLAASSSLKRKRGDEDEENLEINKSAYLRPPRKNFKKTQRGKKVPRKEDYEPEKKRPRPLDPTIPQPGPTPKGEEPQVRPLVVNGTWFENMAGTLKRKREEDRDVEMGQPCQVLTGLPTTEVTLDTKSILVWIDERTFLNTLTGAVVPISYDQSANPEQLDRHLRQRAATTLEAISGPTHPPTPPPIPAPMPAPMPALVSEPAATPEATPEPVPEPTPAPVRARKSRKTANATTAAQSLRRSTRVSGASFSTAT